MSGPAHASTRQIYHLGADGLSEAPVASPAAVFQIRSPQITGGDSGRWGGYGGESPDLPLDQRIEDARSLCFDTPPLAADIEILGAPEVHLTLSADRPQAHLTARLCDVAPDGTSALITYGPLNLTHRDSHEHPSALEPGRFYEITLKLNDIARRDPQGPSPAPGAGDRPLAHRLAGAGGCDPVDLVGGKPIDPAAAPAAGRRMPSSRPSSLRWRRRPSPIARRGRAAAGVS